MIKNVWKNEKFTSIKTDRTRDLHVHDGITRFDSLYKIATIKFSAT